MLTQERYHSILSIINEKHAVTVSELSQLLDTSESTIRRDLTALDRLGKLKKVFGGATSIKQTISVIEDDTTLKETAQLLLTTRILSTSTPAQPPRG